jgi:putative molybdopterin biosynthesis protein
MSADGASRLAPQVAYQRWLDALAGAGWSARRADTELVAVGEALGRVTAAPVIARWPSPRADCAAMDGIAVQAADLAAAVAAASGPGATTATADAGAADGPAGAGAPADDAAGAATAAHGAPGGGAARLAAGRFAWIDTGDPMPAGADTVVARERLLPQADGSVVITADDPEPGHGGHRSGHAASKRNVRTAGEDFAAGEVLVPAGWRLRPADLAAAAAGGHATVRVTPQPVVAIIPTGDEIRPVGSTLRFGEIADTNSLMLAGRCRQLGAVPVIGAVVPDDPDALAAELRRAAAQADLVLVIAGSSRGRGDHAGAVLAQVGGVAVAGVAVRPGHPALLGHAKRPEPGASQSAGVGPAADSGHRSGIAPVIGLPGYPIATAVIFELFAVPLLAALQGHHPARDTAAARLDRDWASPADIEDWVLVTLTPGVDGGVPLATPARRGAGSISLLARADAWWAIPAGQGTFPAGAQIQVLPIPAS